MQFTRLGINIPLFVMGGSKGRRNERKRSRSRSRSRDKERRRRSRSRSRDRDRGRERPTKDVKVEIKAEPVAVSSAGGASGKKLSLAEQKALLLAKKEALLRKKAGVTSATHVKQESKPNLLRKAVTIALKEKLATNVSPLSLASLHGATDGPIPLILDEQGRQVDLTGKVVSGNASKAASNKSLLFNKRVEREKIFGKADGANAKIEPLPKEMYDPRLGVAAPARRDRKKSFRFVEPGTIVRKADRARAEQQLENLNQQMAAQSDGEEPVMISSLPSMIAETREKELAEQTPAFEWWDLALVAGDELSSMAGPESYSELEMEAKKHVTNLIEHPKMLASLKSEGKEAVVPLMLTTQERKRMRREQRVAKQEATRNEITLGLIPPPPPKVKLSNMERVYGSRMVENPTAVEAEVRKAMQARLMKHLTENEARKLTPTQKREKKLAAVIVDRKEDLQAQVYRIDDLSNSKLLWKVQTNAKQCHCTGVLVTLKGINVLVVEGGKKAMTHMKKLMLRRIDWTEKNEEDDDEEEAAGSQQGGEAQANNKCALVWEGAIARPAFAQFVVEPIEDNDMLAARKIFHGARVPQYWDVASSSKIDDALVLNQKKNL